LQNSFFEKRNLKEKKMQQQAGNKFIRRKIVPGALGIGKVEMIFKEKPQKKRRKILAMFLYVTFLFCIYFSFGWSREYLKEKQLIPGVRGIFKLLDYVKLEYFTQVKTEKGLFSFKNVEIARKKDNVIISGGNKYDFFHAQGYLHAVDRLFQMEIYRRAAKGSLSHIFGDKTLYFDKFSRIANFYQAAEHDRTTLNEETLIALQAYVDGINTYLETESALAIPLDFQISYGLFQLPVLAKWEILDSLTVLRMMLYEWNPSSWENDLLQFLAENTIGSDRVSELFSPSPSNASENDLFSFIHSVTGTTLAVGSKFTKNGNSLLSSDFYSTNRQQGYWYPLQFQNDQFNVTGLSFPGIPFILMGNQGNSFSWTFQFHQEGSSPLEQLYRIKKFDAAHAKTIFTRSEIISLNSGESSYPLLIEENEKGCKNIYPLLENSLTGKLNSVLNDNGEDNLFLCPVKPKSLTSISSHPLELFHHLNFEPLNENKVSEFMLSDGNLLRMNVFYALNNGSVGMIGNKLDAIKNGDAVRTVSETDMEKDISRLQQLQQISKKSVLTDGIIISSDPAHYQRIVDLLKLDELSSRIANNQKLSDDNNGEQQVCSGDEVDSQTCRLSPPTLSHSDSFISSKKLETVLKDNFSPSAYNYSQFMILLIDDIITNQASFPQNLNFTVLRSDNLVKLKENLMLFDGKIEPSSEIMIYIEGFRSLLLMKMLHPLTPMVDSYLGNNITAISRASSSVSHGFTLHRVRKTTDFLFHSLPESRVPQQKSKKNSKKPKNNAKLHDFVQANYWMREFVQRNSFLTQYYREDRDFLVSSDYNLRVVFLQLFQELFEWIDYHYPVPKSWVFNHGVRRRWGRVHSYHNFHAVSPVRLSFLSSLNF
jgi:hypothetical protein